MCILIRAVFGDTTGTLSEGSSTYLWLPPNLLQPTSDSSVFIVRWDLWQSGGGVYTAQVIHRSLTPKRKSPPHPNVMSLRSSRCLSAWEQIPINVNRPPQGGSVTALPSSGVSLQTNFSIRASGWSDPESDLPLRYSFKGGDVLLVQDTAATVTWVSACHH